MPSSMRSLPVARTEVQWSEAVLLASCSAVWLLTILADVGVVPLAGILTLDLYRLYSIAAVLGWLAGNVYLLRVRASGATARARAAGATEPRTPPRRPRRRLLLSYLLGPLAFVYGLRSLAALEVQQAAPLVPIYGFGVYALFFLVPLTLRATQVPRRGLKDP